MRFKTKTSKTARAVNSSILIYQHIFMKSAQRLGKHPQKNYFSFSEKETNKKNFENPLDTLKTKSFGRVLNFFQKDM